MKCIAVLFVLSALCCCALSAAVPATKLQRSRLVAQRRMSSPVRSPNKYAQRRQSVEEEFAAEDPATNEVIPSAEEPSIELTTISAAVDAPQPPQKDIEEADVEAEEEEDEEPSFVPAFAKQQPHMFFPMQFGSQRGGAIAVANAFSTGKGAAMSHAVAHGSSRRH